MVIKYKTTPVDVINSNCFALDCFILGQDKGTFVQGRGYTNYYNKPKNVCWTRHINGCPATQKCNSCNTIYGPAIQKVCPRCKIPLNSLE